MRRIIAITSICAAAIACGDDHHNDEVPPPPETGLKLADLCRELAAADCARLDRCAQLIAPFNMDRCLVRQMGTCSVWATAVTNAVGSNEVSYFELSAKACKEKVSKLSCDVGIDFDFTTDPDCKGMLGPMRNENESCALAASCNDGSYCDGRTACPGLCRKLKTNNEACSLADPCAKEFFCATPVMRCHARVAANAPCEVSIGGNACVDLYFCDTKPSGAVCSPVHGRGGGCTTPYQCAAGLRCINNLCSGGQEHDACATNADCTAGLQCGGNRCAKVIEPGMTCASSALCREGFACSTSSTSASMACNARPVLDADCDQMNGPFCYQSHCVAAKCTTPAADGEACLSAGDCAVGHACTMDQCTLPAPDCSGL